MEILSVALVCAATGTFAVSYIVRIRRHQVSPTPSTWIILLVGIGLSFVSYVLAENWNIRAGVLNTIDVVVASAICCAVLFCGKREIRFRPFEKWYLIVAGGIVVYGLLSGGAWKSNIYTQALLSVAYFPTMQNIIRQRRNTESVFCWGCGLVASTTALYPAASAGNTLTMLYAFRASVLVSITLGLMLYYHRRMTGAHAP